MQKRQTDLHRLAEVLRDIRFTMMTTVEEDGTLATRPMTTQKIDEDFDGELWFFAKKDSPLTRDIERERRVNLAYADPDHQRYASVKGEGFLEENSAKVKELWNPFLRAWFPEGPEDPEIQLIRIEVHSAEIWDAPPGKVVQLAGLAKSLVTGKPIDRNLSSEHVDLH